MRRCGKMSLSLTTRRKAWYEFERVEDYEDGYHFNLSEALGDLRFNECFSAPILHTRSAVVGHRVIGECARHAMKDQFARTMKEHKRWPQAVVKVKDVEELRKKFEAMHLSEVV